MTEMNLTKHQKQALCYLAQWDHEWGGLGYADGRSAQELIKRSWVVECIEINRGITGIMTCGMRYVITVKGRKAARDLGWKP